MIGLYPGLYPFIPPIGTPILPINRPNYTQPTSTPNKIDIEIKKKTTTSSGKNADLQDLKNKINDLNKIYNVIFRHICMKKQNILHDMYTGVDADLRKLYPNYDTKEFCLGDIAPLENPPTAPTPVAQQALTAAQAVKAACDAVKVQIDIIGGGVAVAVVAAQALLDAPLGATRQQVAAALVLAQQAVAAAVAAVAAGGLTLQQARDAELAARQAEAEAQIAINAAASVVANAANAAAAQVQINAAVAAAQIAVNNAQAAVALVPAGTKGNCIQPMFEKAKLNTLIDNLYNNQFVYKSCRFKDAAGDYPINVSITQAGGKTDNNYIDLFSLLKDKPLKNDNYTQQELHNFNNKWAQERDMFRNATIDMLLMNDVNKQLSLMKSTSHLLPAALLNKDEYNKFYELYNEFKNNKNKNQ
jgi:hypothetical protein